ncbi:MAG: M28 family peptidase [Gemmatimonadetes bacterium]|nr:M28 family peptidase [Gemmatimonadota bacterium]
MMLALVTLAAGGCSEGGDIAFPVDEIESSPVRRPAFDGAVAFTLLERQVAFGPRVPGTAGHAAQLRWMREWLLERADSVSDQSFTHRTLAGDTLRLTNLFASFRPEERRRVLLLAHWDTRPTSDAASDPGERSVPVPGTNDGASGTAVLLHLAELLRRDPPPIGVDILLVDGEDYGPTLRDMLLGATWFAANLPTGYDPTYAVLLDMVGDRDPRFPVEGYSAEMAPAVASRIWGIAASLGYGDIFPAEVGPHIVDDHLPLNRAGLPTVSIIDFEYGPGNSYWHTPRDVPANTSPRTLGIVGEVLAELIYRGG